MAKKQKVELTPEEKAAKKLRHSNGWVRFWAIVASKTASKESAATGTVAASGSSTGSSSSSSGSSSGSSSSSSSGASASSSSSGASASAGDSSGAAAAASSGVDAAAAAEAINAATAKAVEADLNSVVGGFIGIGDKEMDIAKGGNAAEQIEYHGENYALQATSLQASDLKNLKVDGNTYTFEVENASSPQTDKSTAMSRLTNDILTQDQVSTEIKNFVSAANVNSAAIEYSNIKATVVIEDGTLKEFKYSYDGKVTDLNIKIAIVSVNGKGAMHVEGAYTNFAY